MKIISNRALELIGFPTCMVGVIFTSFGFYMTGYILSLIGDLIVVAYGYSTGQKMICYSNIFYSILMVIGIGRLLCLK